MAQQQHRKVRLVQFRACQTPEKSKFGIFRVLAAIVLPVWSLFVKYRFVPNSALPKSGPFILAPNHISEIDPIAFAVAVYKLGRLPRFIAKASLFKIPLVGGILRLTGQIPVERERREQSSLASAVTVEKSVKKQQKKGEKAVSSSGRSAIKAAAQLIANNSGVIVYPEGTLTRDPGLWPMRGKSGAARLALESEIPLYPAAHWGIQDLLPRYGKKINLWGRKTVCVAIGQPLDLSAYRGKPVTNAVINEVTEKLMAEITALLEMLRQEKAPAKRWDPRDHRQSETGRF